MASAKVISWILGNGLYAYIYMPDNKPQICGKIVEDSPLWTKIVEKVREWEDDEGKYKEAYENLSKLVIDKGYTLPAYDPKFFNGGTDLDGYKLALLSGVGGGANGYGGNSGGGHGNDYDPYKEFSDNIQKELDKARNELDEKKRVIEKFITENFNETYEEAKIEIRETKQKLDETHQKLEEQLNDAKNALELAKNALKDGVVDPDEMNKILNTIQEYSYWMDEYSGVITSLKSEYDDVNGRMGSIGESEDVSKGLFAKFAACIDVLSGNVGTVHEWMDASEGTIGQMASWYNETLSSATEAIRFMSASAGVISDTISYIQGDGEDSLTTYLSREMDAINATIEDKIQAESENGISSLRREMDALNATITEQITHLAPNSALTSMGERMDALSGTMEQWMIIVSDLSGTGVDLREEWSEASGKLSTVAQLMAETDSDGNILYFVSGDSFEERVYKNENGQWVDATGGVWDDGRVYAKYSTVMQSWFQQQANEISIGIEDKVKELVAGIDLSFSGDESYIKLIADKVVIDADMIAKAISAKTANIGGILMGDGIIQSLKKEDDGTPYFLLDGENGKIYAQDAVLKGAITATTLYVGSDKIDKYIGDRVPTTDNIETAIQSFVESERFSEIIKDGFVTKEEVERWLSEFSGGTYTKEQIDALLDALQNAQVSTSVQTEELSNGATKYTIKIGDTEYSWEVFNTGKYLLIGDKFGNGNSGDGTSFMVDTNGLMVASNAVVWGKIFASEGYFQGSVSADSGYFKGDIEARSLKVGTIDIDEYVENKIPTSGNIQSVIQNFVNSPDFSDIIQDGFVTKGELQDWTKRFEGIYTKEQIDVLIDELEEAQVSTSVSAETLDNGKIRYHIQIGENVYSWDVLNAGDYLLLGDKLGNGDSGNGNSFMVSTDGLMVASNAVVWGKIYASEGYFKGSVSADSGYFKGDIVAKTLKIGETDIDAYIDDRVPSGTPTMGDIEKRIEDALDDMDIDGIISGKGYITNADLEEYFTNNPTLTEEQVSAICNTLIGATINVPEEPYTDESGRTVHTINIGTSSYTWYTIDGGDYVVLDRGISGESASTVISKNGLLQANNAIIYGEIYAQKGTIGGFSLDDRSLISKGNTAILDGSISHTENGDMFKLGLDVSDKVIFYAFKASGSCSTTASTPSQIDSTWSSVTSQQYVYIQQKDVEEGDEITVYYINSGTQIGDKPTLSTYNADDVSVVVIKEWLQDGPQKTGCKIRLKYTYKQGIGAQSRYEYYTKDTSGNNDLTTRQCSYSGYNYYNTVITSNGIITCDTINANNGYFAGSINSDGYFNGELNCNKGTLSNIVLKNPKFSGGLNLKNTLLNAMGEDGTTYLNILPYSVYDTSAREYSNVSYSCHVTNSNGTLGGKTYVATNDNSGSVLTLLSIPVQQGDKIEIPSLICHVKRYIPTMNIGYNGYVKVAYECGSKKGVLFEIVLPNANGRVTQNFTNGSNRTTFTATTNTNLLITIEYIIHLSKYSWLGADKASFSIDLYSNDNNGKVIKVTPSGNINKGIVFGQDGFVIKYGNVGFRVTETDGVQIYDNKTSEWTNL